MKVLRATRLLGPGHPFGEGCLNGHLLRVTSATTIQLGRRPAPFAWPFIMLIPVSLPFTAPKTANATPANTTDTTLRTWFTRSARLFRSFSTGDHGAHEIFAVRKARQSNAC